MELGREMASACVGAPAVVWCGDGEGLPRGGDAVGLLGEKAARLREMFLGGLPVPPFFVITTAAVGHAVSSAGLDSDVQLQIRRGLERLEQVTHKTFGDEREPLLLTIRCSAADSPAGLLPSVQNIGMSPRIAQTLLSRSADERFVFDCYRRLVMQFARVAHDVDLLHFERDLRLELDNRGLSHESELDGPAMRELARRYQGIYSIRVGSEFPNEPHTQFRRAVEAALRAGESPRVRMMRQRTGDGAALPVAVIVQAMVFGNRAEESFAGVACTRDPVSGADRLTGEYLPTCQGIDVAAVRASSRPLEELRGRCPQISRQLEELAQRLEIFARDAQEFEFTVEMGRTWILQARDAGRANAAAVRIAVEMAQRKVISRAEAVKRIGPESVEKMLHSRFADDAGTSAVCVGFAASPGVAVGRLAFSAAEALKRSAQGEAVILVRRETDAADVIGMQRCAGVLTSTGGMTSHAAVVARGMGIACVAGAGELEIDERRRTVAAGRYRLRADDWVSIDGASGEVFVGQRACVTGEMSPELSQLLSWADELRSLGVYANADTPEDVRRAIELGAEGIGLCRTEHMFFAARRITQMRKMILAGRDDVATRQEALDALLPYQREDFRQIFSLMRGRPVIVRLLDPPLHEFLPRGREDVKELAQELGLTQREVRRRIEQLEETNPMLGHRGCRLAVSFPEILRMQVRAIVEAAALCLREGRPAEPLIMVPMPIGKEEIALLRQQVREAAEAAMRDVGVLVEYRVGAMIETPRAALMAGEIADHAQFLSFGTNDLTQATLAVSRDDSGKFVEDYQRQNIMHSDPFRVIDRDGVGELMTLAISRGRAVRKELSFGVCGEHAGEASSIEFFHQCGVNYISCSPRRLPVARLAAAQAVLRARG